MCLFCEIPQCNPLDSQFPENIILDETNDFYLKSALGQFIDGYVLINAKNHLTNYSYLVLQEKYEALELFIHETKKKIASVLGSKEFIVFEHGSTNRFCGNQKCETKCIDHAHLHVIPTKINIMKDLEQAFEVIKIVSIAELNKYRNSSYIYYSPQNEEHYIIKIAKPIPSQFIRKLISEKTGLPELWNWSEYPFREKISLFNHTFLKHKRKNQSS